MNLKSVASPVPDRGGTRKKLNKQTKKLNGNVNAIALCRVAGACDDKPKLNPPNGVFERTQTRVYRLENGRVTRVPETACNPPIFRFSGTRVSFPSDANV